VYCEIQQTARIGQVSLGPEQRHRPVARKRLRPYSDDQRQQRDAVALCWWTIDRSIPGTQACATEKLDRNHRFPSAS
jgi:hypothetical protein